MLNFITCVWIKNQLFWNFSRISLIKLCPFVYQVVEYLRSQVLVLKIFKLPFSPFVIHLLPLAANLEDTIIVEGVSTIVPPTNGPVNHLKPKTSPLKWTSPSTTPPKIERRSKGRSFNRIEVLNQCNFLWIAFAWESNPSPIWKSHESRCPSVKLWFISVKSDKM